MAVTDEAAVTLAPDPRSAAQARRFVTEELRRAGAAALVDAAELLVSELVANALLHAQGEVTVTVVLSTGTARVEVSDASPQAPRRRRFSAEASTGRGLLLVESMASDWGVITNAGGKTVWFELGDDVA